MNSNDAISQLSDIRSRALPAIGDAAEAGELEKLKIEFLGRKSPISQIGKLLGAFKDDERRVVGSLSNEVRDEIEAALEARKFHLASVERERDSGSERLDVTLPGRTPPLGRIHPLTEVMEEILDTFIGLGFSVVEGPIVETDYYNFEALNIPADHAARSMHDTLYVNSEFDETLLVRTHTSPMQIRIMESAAPPIFVVVPGMVGRNEEIGPNNLAIFNQVEGLAVDEGITFADLKGTLEKFAQAMFGAHLRVRLHPSYFPFTEPSAEVYVSCFNCDGSGCGACKQEGWIEIMGAGMVHPNVFRMSGYDPERYTGFAFGMGIERIAKLRYEVADLRTFFESDLKFLGAV